MVWPITGAESYVCKTDKSMKAVELAVGESHLIGRSASFCFSAAGSTARFYPRRKTGFARQRPEPHSNFLARLARPLVYGLGVTVFRFSSKDWPSPSLRSCRASSHGK